MGDYATIGISRMQYRTAISNLQKWGFITINATSKGTVVTLSTSSIYDLNANNQPSQQPANNHHDNHQATIKQPTVQPLNKNDKNDKNDKEVVIPSRRAKTYPADFELFWKAYPSNRRGSKQRALVEWKIVEPVNYQLIVDHVLNRKVSDPGWLKDQGKFICHAERFLKGCRWEETWVQPRQYSETTARSIQNLKGLDLNA